MRHLPLFLPLFLSLPLCLLIAPAAAQPAQSPPSATATLLARSTLLGVQIAIRKQRQEAKVSGPAADCVESQTEEELVPVLSFAISKSWSPEELQANDAFLRTPLGGKYAKSSLLLLHQVLGFAIPEPMPELTPAEQAELQTFSETTAGHKLIVEAKWSNPESQDIIRAGVVELLVLCGVRR